jgi:predicted O-methyltransferase YrrM
MRTLQLGGSDKFWTGAHSERRRESGQSQRWSYAHFLYFLHFGPLSDWSIDPMQLIPGEFLHLFGDAADYWPLMRVMFPEIKTQWDGLTTHWLERAMHSKQIRRAMSLHHGGNGSMNTYIELVKKLPDCATVVEVGSLYGGSVVTLAVAVLHKNLRVISIESFTGNLDNTVDGGPIADINEYLRTTKQAWPNLNIDTIPLPGQLAAAQFADESLNFVFIDGDHSTEAVRRDIAVWWPKIAPGGILAGDDFSWGSVAEAVKQAFPHVTDQHSVWWVTK